MLKIEIDSAEVITKSGVSGKGKPYSIPQQVGYAAVFNRDTGKLGKYPVAIRFALGEDAKPYAVGHYTIDDRSFTVGQYGDLEVGRIVLAPLAK